MVCTYYCACHKGSLEPPSWQASRSSLENGFGASFENSPIELDRRLAPVWMGANCKNEVGFYKVHCAVGVMGHHMIHSVAPQVGDADWHV